MTSKAGRKSQHTRRVCTTIRAQLKDLDPGKLPSFHELKGDSKIQAEVDKHLQANHNTSRTDLTGKSNTAIKAGRFRAGIAKIKNPISWPQDFCAVNVGNKQPTYDEMSLEQWIQGMLFCILEETDSKNKDVDVLCIINARCYRSFSQHSS